MFESGELLLLAQSVTDKPEKDPPQFFLLLFHYESVFVALFRDIQ